MIKRIQWSAACAGSMVLLLGGVTGCGRKSVPVVAGAARFNQAAGVVLGQEAARQAPRSGPVWVVWGREPDTEVWQELVDAFSAGVRHGLADTPHDLVVTTVSALAPGWDPDRLPGMTVELPWPSLLSKEPAPVVVILADCVPPIRAQLPAKRPSVILFRPTMETAQALLARNAAQAAAVYRPDADWSVQPRRNMSPRQVFDLQFKLLKATTDAADEGCGQDGY